MGLTLPPSGWSAETSTAGADEVRTGLERYLGRGVLTVDPVGAGYKVQIDLKAMMSWLGRIGVSLEPATYAIDVTPTGNGVWHVTSGNLPTITASFNGQTTSIVSNGQRFEGSYDTRLPAFTQATGHYDSLSVGMIDKGASTQARQATNGDQTLSAVATGDGVIDAKVVRSDATLAQDIAVDNPSSHFALSIKTGKTTDALAIEGLHARALADVWAFFVAHPSADAVKASQPALRTLLQQALPLFRHWRQDGTAVDLTVESPIGRVGARNVATKIDLNGLTDQGSAGITITADGLTLPTDRLPPWSATLMPTAVQLATAISGFRLDEAARTAVEDFDLNAPQPLSQATLDKISGMVGSRDKLLISIGASHIASATLDTHFSGEIRLTEPTPTLALSVQATGLDKTIETVQAAAKHDPSAAQALTLLALARGYGKPDRDGALSWAIAMSEGDILVNGVPLPSGGAK